MLLDPWGDRIERGDCLHVFGLSRAALELAITAKRAGAAVVVSPILWYQLRALWGAEPSWGRRLRLTVGYLARCSRIPFADWKRRLLHLADLVLPNSRAEARQLERYFAVDSKRIRVVPNAVDPAWLDEHRPEEGPRDIVLCVGRIEPRKNQLTVIRAVNELGIPLGVVGPVSDPDYGRRCRQAAADNVTFVGPLFHRGPALARLMWRARAVILASWFETPGLAALEGACAGANVVITQFGCTREYFADFAYYVHPRSISGIRQAIWSAWHAAPPLELAEHVRSRYRWTMVGRQLASLYREIVGVPEAVADETKAA